MVSPIKWAISKIYTVTMDGQSNLAISFSKQTCLNKHVKLDLNRSLKLKLQHK